MSKPDFDFSKYVQVPDEWIQNALDIPNTAHEAPKTKPLPYRRIAAAGIVLAAIIGISVFFLIGNKTPIPVAPSKPNAATEKTLPLPTDSTEPVKPTAPDSTQAPSFAPSQPASQPATQISTDAQGGIIVITTVTTHTVSDPTDPVPSSPSDPTQPAPTGKPIPSPTAAGPSQRLQPTAEETAPPTPTQGATEPPNDIEFNDSGIVEVILPAPTVPMSTNTDGYIYCRVYDADGRLLGESDLYCIEHRMSWTTPDGRAKLYYAVQNPDAEETAHSVPDSAGSYTYVLYLSNGKVIDSGSL